MSSVPFVQRHVGPSAAQIAAMLERVGAPSLDALIDQTLPAQIRTGTPLDLPPALTEHQAMAALAERAAENRVLRSYLGYGYAGTLTPPTRQRSELVGGDRGRREPKDSATGGLPRPRQHAQGGGLASPGRCEGDLHAASARGQAVDHGRL